jgi:hypothetical protein
MEFSGFESDPPPSEPGELKITEQDDSAVTRMSYIRFLISAEETHVSPYPFVFYLSYSILNCMNSRKPQILRGAWITQHSSLSWTGAAQEV